MIYSEGTVSPPFKCVQDWRKGAMRVAWLLGPMSKKGKYVSCYLQYDGLFSNRHKHDDSHGHHLPPQHG